MDGQAHLDFAPGHFGGLTLNSVYQSRTGEIYLGSTEAKVVVMDSMGNYRLVDTGGCSTINSFNQDRLGRVWAVSDTGVGYFLDGRFHEVEGVLISASMENMIEDYERNLWFSSSRHGVLEAVRSKFHNISQAARLPEMTVNSTLIYENSLYIAADEGLFIIDKNGRAVQNDLTRRLGGVRLRCLMKDGDGALWICAYNRLGLIRYKDGRFLSITDGPLSDKIRCVIALRDGGVAAGRARGVAVVREGRVVKSWQREDGLGNPVILGLYEDERGVIYAGSDGGGIYRLDGQRVTNLSEREGLPSGIILRMTPDKKYGGTWVSTGNSLSFIDGEGGVQVIEGLGISAANIFDIRLVGEDGIWLLNSGGVLSGSRADFLKGAPLLYERFHHRDGLASPLTANSWSHMEEDGTIYLCATKGVLSIGTEDIYRNLTIPKLVISQAEVDGKIIDRPAEVILAPEANRLSLTFSLLSYAANTGNRANVILRGFDKNPTEISTDLTTTVSYTNLPAGRYSFEVYGLNKDGMQSHTVILPVIKQPRLLERGLVRFALVAGVIVAGVILARAYSAYKTREIIKRQNQYREITRQSIKAIADTIDAKDRYTAGHSRRVAEYCQAIADRLGLRESQREDLYYTALLHDIGKIGLEDRILNKQAPLDEEELEKMRNHVNIGGEILKSITMIQDIATGAKYHHERYDGQGYCEGLKAEDIPLFARIICVADTYDAMNTDRPYRRALSKEKIIEELERGAGAQFDAAIAKVMVDLIREME